MPSKKKKYNARFPAGRIKKIMQTDEEVGKVAQAVPIIISRTLELFVESLLTKSMQITQARNAKTLTPSHMKQCILSESRFDFLKDLVNNIPDASAQEDNENNAIFEANLDEDEKVNDFTESEEIQHMETSSSCNEQSTSSRTPVIQYGPKVTQNLTPKLNVTVSSLVKNDSEKSDVQITVGSAKTEPKEKTETKLSPDNIPPLIPISHSYYSQNTSDTLCIDEDYDN